ncbi:phosphotransacetylase family protein [Halospeciosus flavus]|uniref:phosphotransacetylase family protein n=1 Tax=Halospeciosus flavus TaxID=3032283 RepID=UPI003606B0B3
MASTEESTGKTAVSLALATIAADRGDTVGYMKPKGTRLQSNVGKTLDTDPLLARDVLGLDAETHELEPIVYSPTFVDGVVRGRENAADLRERVREAFEAISEDTSFVAVEGADTISTGAAVDLTDPEVADLLDASVVLVSRFDESRDVDAVLDAADRFGERLDGIVFNAVPDAQYDRVDGEVASFLESKGVPVLGSIPRVQDLAGVSVADLADELGARMLTDADTSAYVERFVVGAMSGEAALSHFRRTKDAAVVTGGDRTDVQTAALDAPGVNCLVLTGGHEPPGAVLGKAEERGVPVLVVTTDTLTTIERGEELVRGGRVRDAETVKTMRDLLERHTDLDALL